MPGNVVLNVPNSSGRLAREEDTLSKTLYNGGLVEGMDGQATIALSEAAHHFKLILVEYQTTSHAVGLLVVSPKFGSLNGQAIGCKWATTNATLYFNIEYAAGGDTLKISCNNITEAGLTYLKYGAVFGIR